MLAFALKTTKPSAGSSADSRPSYSPQAVHGRKQKRSAKRRHRYEVKKSEISKQQKEHRISDHYKQFYNSDYKEEIEWWDGDIQNGGFVSGLRSFGEKEAWDSTLMGGKERTKQSAKGCIVAKKSSPWIFGFIRVEWIKYKQPITVLWGHFLLNSLLHQFVSPLLKEIKKMDVVWWSGKMT